MDMTFLNVLLPMMFEGLKLTILIAVVGITIGFLIGSLCGYLLQSKYKIGKAIAEVYIWIIRATPLMAVSYTHLIDPDDYERFDEMVELFCELRKSKGVTPEQAAKTLKKNNYFGTMLVKMGVADALLGGATYSTADTVRPALQLIKTKPGSSCVSSCFILVRPSATGENEVLAMGDCAINLKPSEDQLAEIAWEVAECGKHFGIDPKAVSYTHLDVYKRQDMVSALDDKMLSLNEAILECLKEGGEKPVPEKTEEVDAEIIENPMIR